MSDLIERSEVLKQLWLNQKDVVYIDKIECARRIEAIPSARPKGEWQIDKDDDIYHCSKCFFEIDASGCIDPTEYISIYNFCPNCGADMRPKGE